MPTFVWGRPLNEVSSMILMGLALIALFMSIAAVNGGRARALTLFLRCIALSAALIVFFRGSLLFTKKELIRRPLAILVDTSQSMDLPSFQANPRWDEVLNLFKKKDLWNRLNSDFDLRWYSLSGHLLPATLDELTKIKHPSGIRSELRSGIQEVSLDRSSAGVLLISDGVDTSAHATPPDISIPVVALHPEISDRFRDVAIQEVNCPEIIFLKNKVACEVGIESFPVTEGLTLRVSSGERLLHEQPISPGVFTENRARLSVNFVPERLGTQILTMAITRLPGEITYDNNEMFSKIKVVRERTRVLHVAGRPTWDERFLREYLKDNPNIDLVSFFILRTLRNNPEASERELSLIPFPYQDLFTKELENFDLVIFQNFDFKTYFSSFYLENLRSYVEGGGAFAMVGGDLSFGQGGYASTPVEDILPMRMASQSEEIRYQSFQPVLSERALEHPVLRGTALRPQDLPKLTSFHQMGSLQSNSTVLLSHGSAPVLATRNVGKGRVVSIATDSLWRWQFSESPRGQRAYRGIWNGIYRWLTREISSEYIKLSPASPLQKERPGQFTVQVFTKNFEPLAQAKLKVTVKDATGTDRPFIAAPTDAKGESTFRIPDLWAGWLEVTASVPDKGEDGYLIREVFPIEDASLELRRRGVDTKFLQRLATRSKGAVESIHQASSKTFAPFYQNAQYQKIGTEEYRLWEHPLLLLLAILCMTLEWYFRRRHGAS